MHADPARQSVLKGLKINLLGKIITDLSFLSVDRQSDINHSTTAYGAI